MQEYFAQHDDYTALSESDQRTLFQASIMEILIVKVIIPIQNIWVIRTFFINAVCSAFSLIAAESSTPTKESRSFQKSLFFSARMTRLSWTVSSTSSIKWVFKILYLKKIKLTIISWYIRIFNVCLRETQLHGRTGAHSYVDFNVRPKPSRDCQFERARKSQVHQSHPQKRL